MLDPGYLLDLIAPSPVMEFHLLLLALLLGISCMSCALPLSAPHKHHIESPHFVLVHGANASGASFNPIKRYMEAAGYKVTAVDLDNNTQFFDDYNKPLMDLMSRFNEHKKMILLGVSAGGLSVTEACHKFPDKIGIAIYVAASMLKQGYKDDEDIKIGVPEKFLPKMVNLTAMREEPGYMRKFVTAEFNDTDAIDSVPRIYFRTKKDRILKPYQQTAMIEKWPGSRVYNLNSGHNPNPLMLFKRLKKVIKGYKLNNLPSSLHL